MKLRVIALLFVTYMSRSKSYMLKGLKRIGHYTNGSRSSLTSNENRIDGSVQRNSEDMTTIETAVKQYKRLFQEGDAYDPMGKKQRLLRIFSSWTLLILAKSIALASPLYFKTLIEKGAEADKDMSMMGMISSSLQYSALGLILGYGAMKVAAGLVQFLGEIILSPASTHVSEVLPRQAFSAALLSASKRQDEMASASSSPLKQNPSKQADEGRSGFARRALDRGLRASNQLLYRSIFNLLPAFVESFCVLVLICRSTNKLVGLTAGIVVSLFVFFTSFIMGYRVKYHRNQLRAENVANGYAEDALSLAETVASFGALEIEKDRYAKSLQQVSKASIIVRYSFSGLKLLQALIMGGGSIALMLAAWFSHQSLPPNSKLKSIAGTLVLTQALFAQMCAPLDHVGQHFRDCVAAAEDLRDLEKIVQASELNSQSTQKQRDIITVAAKEKQIDEKTVSLKDALQIFPVQSSHLLEVSNLTYAYANSDKSILKDISLTIPYGGYSVGIVGPSGSGKTTLLRIILGLEDLDSNKHNSGSIYLHGRDLTHLCRVPFFSVVGQDNDLFRGLDLMQNVEYGAYTLPHYQDISDTQKVLALHNAAEDAQLGEVIEKGGWRKEVGPRGRLLSGGERQRVCLARALYREELMCSAGLDSILVMDEVTSSLDVKTESQVMGSVFANRVKRQGGAVFMIAHRLSSIQACDKIIVMKDGCIVESGSHVQLLAKKGWYAEAWQLQSAAKQ